jgi:hypothetical protein
MRRASCVGLLVSAALPLIGCGNAPKQLTGPDNGDLARLGLTRDLPPRLVHACDEAADLSAIEVVYCPPVVPVGPVSDIQFVDLFQKAVRVRGKPRARPVPHSYRVHLDSPSIADRESLGHWAFEAGPPRQIEAVLHPYTEDPTSHASAGESVLSARSVELSGIPSDLLRMARYPLGGIHGGHVVVRWSFAGTDYLLSLHGYENEDRALAMAEGLIMLIQNCPAGTRNEGDRCAAAIDRTNEGG